MQSGILRLWMLLALSVFLSEEVNAQRVKEVPVPPLPFLPPEKVSIFPVFFVASDQPNPSREQGVALIRHLTWAQRWYRDALKEGGTFEIFSDQAYLFRGRYPLAYYVGQDRGKRAPVHLQELLEHFQLTRFNCPFIFVMIVDELNERPNGGRPINSGFNGGGGIVQMPRAGLTTAGPFQGLLRHELGHSFGLQHVTLYGYDMKTSRSVMSSNPAIVTKGFQEGRLPAVLIPEDIRALALNDRVFPRLEFDEKKHVPRGYVMSPKMIPINPMLLPDGPADKVLVVSKSGEGAGNKAQNLVRRKIVPNERSETNKQGIYFDPKSMWHSDNTKTEWRTLEVTFPVETTLTGIRIHSQHSGRVHPVKRFRVSTIAEQGDAEITSTEVEKDDQSVTFAATTSVRWKLDFQPGTSGKVALRGLQFYYKETELFAAVTTDEDADPIEEE